MGPRRSSSPRVAPGAAPSGPTSEAAGVALEDDPGLHGMARGIVEGIETWNIETAIATRGAENAIVTARGIATGESREISELIAPRSLGLARPSETSATVTETGIGIVTGHLPPMLTGRAAILEMVGPLPPARRLRIPNLPCLPLVVAEATSGVERGAVEEIGPRPREAAGGPHTTTVAIVIPEVAAKRDAGHAIETSETAPTDIRIRIRAATFVKTATAVIET